MNIALVLAGGTGSRLGGKLPKQYLEVCGKPIIAYCLETLEKHPMIDAVRVVAEEEWKTLIREWAGKKLQGFSTPGATRQLSILNGLEDLLNSEGDPAKKVVLIHDAARPLVTARMITDCLEGCGTHEGVMPALPVKDTVYYGKDGRIESLLDRSRVIAGQAPEAFRLLPYYAANQALLPEKILKINGSAEPAVMAGMDVQYIPGDERNFKITTMADLERFRELMRKE